MKRAMSLLLALAMVMSFFTVGAFADTVAPAVTLSPSATQTIVVGGEADLTATVNEYTKDEEKFTYTPSYEWKVTAGEEGGLRGSADGNKATVTGVKAGDYTVTCTLTVTAALKSGVTLGEGESVPEFEAVTDTVNIKVVENNFELKILSISNDADATAQTINLVPGGEQALTVKAELWSKKIAASGDNAEVPAAKVDGASVELSISPTPAAGAAPLATLTGGTVKAGDKGGKASVVATCEYLGETYTKTIASIDIATIGITEEILNGYSATYGTTTTSLLAKIQNNINSVLKTDTTNKITLDSVSITPKANSIFEVKVGTSTTATTSAFALAPSAESVTIKAKAGSIDSEEWPYTAVDGSNTYTGTLTLKSIYVETIEVEQDALFTREAFGLGSLGTSNRTIREVRKHSDSVKAYDSTKVYDAYGYLNYSGSNPYYVVPESADKNWTEHLIGYDSDHRAYLVDVKYDAAIYDMVGSAEDGAAGFITESEFLAFAEKVMEEQDYYYDTYTSIYVDSVEFGISSNYDFYDGTKKITSPTYECKDLSKVSIDVKTAGVHYVDFTVNVKYKAGSSNRTTTVDGVLYLLVSSEGDIQYEVSYNDSVTFDVADFQAFFRTASGKTSAKLRDVTFTALPLYGTLYTEPNRYTSAYKVDVADKFFAEPTALQLDLDYVTYAAAASPKTQYSVYIPFTASGTGATTAQSGVVEIIVNGSLPFVDIPSTHTFYEHIKYVYKEGIMNGKTATRFDATSNVTRLQLVRTLYRMAGSPTTYNKKTIAFTDSKSLTGEAASALKWAVNTGLVNGYGNVFKPNDAVTRQAMVTILYRFANYYGYDTTTVGSNNLAGFKDAAKVASSMKEAMNWAVDCGFVSGTSGKMLNPAGSTTRGACAKILATFHDWYIA